MQDTDNTLSYRAIAQEEQNVHTITFQTFLEKLPPLLYMGECKTTQ